MSTHMPPIPPANRTRKGPENAEAGAKDTTLEKHGEPLNVSEQGETANIGQNTTNKGYFPGWACPVESDAGSAWQKRRARTNR